MGKEKERPSVARSSTIQLPIDGIAEEMTTAQELNASAVVEIDGIASSGFCFPKTDNDSDVTGIEAMVTQQTTTRNGDVISGTITAESSPTEESSENVENKPLVRK